MTVDGAAVVVIFVVVDLRYTQTQLAGVAGDDNQAGTGGKVVGSGNLQLKGKGPRSSG